MSYTIESASYANAENTSAMLLTAEAGLVLISAEDTPDEWAAFLAGDVPIAAHVEPSPSTYRLYKSVFINRLDELEAQLFEGALAQASSKLRLWFNSMEYFESDDPSLATLIDTVSSALGGERAGELLGPA